MVETKQTRLRLLNNFNWIQAQSSDALFSTENSLQITHFLVLDFGTQRRENTAQSPLHKIKHHQNDPFSRAFKIVAAKRNKLAVQHRHDVLMARKKQNNVEFLTQQLVGRSAHPSTDNTESHFDALYDKNFTKAEVEIALYTFNDEKAPGPNGVHFRILKLTYEITPQINFCLKLYYFSHVLTQGEVVFLKAR